MGDQKRGESVARNLVLRVVYREHWLTDRRWPELLSVLVPKLHLPQGLPKYWRGCREMPPRKEKIWRPNPAPGRGNREPKSQGPPPNQRHPGSPPRRGWW